MAPIATAEVRIVADTSGFEADLERKLRKSGASSGQAFDREFKKWQKDWAKFQGAKDLERQAGDSGSKAGKSWIKKFFDAINGDGGKKSSKNNSSVLSKVLKGFKSDLKGLGSSAVKFGGIGLAIGGLVGVIAMAAADLSKLTGALALIPNVVGGVVSGFVAMKLALSGFDAAVKAGFSGNTKQFEQALKGLTPAAQTAARAFVELKSPLDALKSTAQQSFFTPIVDSIKQLGQTLSSGPVIEGVRGLATDMGNAMSAIFKFAVNAPMAQASFKALADGMGSLIRSGTEGVTDFLMSLEDVVIELSPLMEQFGKWIGKVAEEFGLWLSQKAMTGQLATWIKQAGHAFEQLGSIILNLGKGFAALFMNIGKLQGQGGGFLDTIQQWSAGFAEWAKTANGAQFAQSLLSFGQTTLQVIKFLTKAFISLMMVVHSVGDAINTVVNFVKGVVNVVAAVFNFVNDGLTRANKAIWAWAKGVDAAVSSGRAIAAIGSWISGAMGAAGKAMQGFAATAGGAVKQVIGFFAGLRGQIQGFFAGAANWLIQAGRNIIDGLIKGIRSMIGSIGSVMGDIAGKVRGFLPHSPAKEGPLSGAGNPESSGRKIGSMLASGIASRKTLVAGAMDDMLTTIPSFQGIARVIPQLETPAHLAAPIQHGSLFGAGGERQPVVQNTQTTTIGPPTINIHTPAQDPALIARRTANRLARLATS